MGLDMYLNATKYLSKNFNKTQFKKIAMITKEAEVEVDFPSITVSKSVGYWRKANHIHKWFVDNVQGGEDNCETYDVSREQLKDLRELCRKVLDGEVSANEELPTKDGCFFGDTDYDEYYYDECKYTIKMIDACLKIPDSWYFEYHSSW